MEGIWPTAAIWIGMALFATLLSVRLRARIDVGMSATRSDIRLTQHMLPGHEVETIITFAKVHWFDLLVIGFLSHSKVFNGEWGKFLSERRATGAVQCAGREEITMEAS